MTTSYDHKNTQARIVAKYFDDAATKYMDHYDTEDHDPYAFKARRNIVQSFITPVPGGMGLDVGCGPGVMVPFFTNNKMSFEGVDVAPSVIEEGRRRHEGEENVAFSVGRVEYLEYVDECFDVVTCMGVLEYLDDDLLGIGEMARTLRPGGTMIVTVPNRLAPYRFLHRTVHPALRDGSIRLIKKILGRPYSPPIHHREYTRKHIKALLEQCGITPMQVGYYGFNILPHPLDRWFEHLNGRIAQRLMGLAHTPLRWIGTGMVVSGIKR
ncbi:MAG: methyltransferase domain-containing protein [Pseudomonadota bacterium]